MDAAFDDADFVVEGEYRTGAQEQLYIETNGMIAEATAEYVTVWGSLQCPFYVHRALKTIFGLQDDRVRVVQTETGGAFGGKEEFPSVLAGHAALLAMKAGRPVKMVYGPRRGYGWDDEAASFAGAASHGGVARRQTAGRGD